MKRDILLLLIAYIIVSQLYSWKYKQSSNKEDNAKLTNYAHLNRGSVNLGDMCATYRPGIVGT